MASCGGETPEDSFGDKKLAFVPGRKPKDMSETIIAVVEGGELRGRQWQRRRRRRRRARDGGNGLKVAGDAGRVAEGEEDRLLVSIT